MSFAFHNVSYLRQNKAFCIKVSKCVDSHCLAYILVVGFMSDLVRQ